jgi:hypothetical protein
MKITFTKKLRAVKIRERLLVLTLDVFVFRPLMQRLEFKYIKLQIYQCFYLNMQLGF